MNVLAAILGALAVGATHGLVGVADARTPGVSGYAGGTESRVVALIPAPATRTVAFKVKGMTCGGCVIAVRKVLSRLAGVSKTDVSYEKGRAVVTYDPAVVTTSQMIAAIQTLGYTATIEASPDKPAPTR